MLYVLVFVLAGIAAALILWAIMGLKPIQRLKPIEVAAETQDDFTAAVRDQSAARWGHLHDKRRG